MLNSYCLRSDRWAAWPGVGLRTIPDASLCEPSAAYDGVVRSSEDLPRGAACFLCAFLESAADSESVEEFGSKRGRRANEATLPESRKDRKDGVGSMRDERALGTTASGRARDEKLVISNEVKRRAGCLEGTWRGFTAEVPVGPGAGTAARCLLDAGGGNTNCVFRDARLKTDAGDLGSDVRRTCDDREGRRTGVLTAGLEGIDGLFSFC